LVHFVVSLSKTRHPFGGSKTRRLFGGSKTRHSCGGPNRYRFFAGALSPMCLFLIRKQTNFHISWLDRAG
jgi:hypothetical protein